MSKMSFNLTGLGAFNAAISAIQTSAASTLGLVNDVVKTDSLVSFTQGGRVEPIVVVDEACLAIEITTDVIQALQAIFTGYYLQAISYTAEIDGVSVLGMLDQFNPNRDPVGHVLNKAAMESFQHRLPDYSDTATRWGAAMESRDDGQSSDGLSVTNKNDIDKLTKEAANLSVGRLVNVTIKKNDKTITVPVSIRLMANLTDSESMTHILSIGSVDNSVKERFHGYMSGRLDFWNDIIMANDIIETHRKNLMKDKSGIYAEIMDRRAKNAASAALTRKMSVATASNMVVVTKSTLEATEAKLGGEFKNYKFRERIFNETYMMIMAVIDQQWQTVTFYTRGISLPTTLSFREVKQSNKGSGPDIFSIFKALEQGAAVRL